MANNAIIVKNGKRTLVIGNDYENEDWIKIVHKGRGKRIELAVHEALEKEHADKKDK